MVKGLNLTPQDWKLLVLSAIMDDVLVMVIYQVKYGEFCSPYLSLFFGKGYQRDGYTRGCF